MGLEWCPLRPVGCHLSSPPLSGSSTGVLLWVRARKKKKKKEKIPCPWRVMMRQSRASSHKNVRGLIWIDCLEGVVGAAFSLSFKSKTEIDAGDGQSELRTNVYAAIWETAVKTGSSRASQDVNFNSSEWVRGCACILGCNVSDTGIIRALSDKPHRSIIWEKERSNSAVTFCTYKRANLEEGGISDRVMFKCDINDKPTGFTFTWEKTRCGFLPGLPVEVQTTPLQLWTQTMRRDMRSYSGSWTWIKMGRSTSVNWEPPWQLAVYTKEGRRRWGRVKQVHILTATNSPNQNFHKLVFRLKSIHVFFCFKSWLGIGIFASIWFNRKRGNEASSNPCTMALAPSQGAHSLRLCAGVLLSKSFSEDPVNLEWWRETQNLPAPTYAIHTFSLDIDLWGLMMTLLIDSAAKDDSQCPNWEIILSV